MMAHVCSVSCYCSRCMHLHQDHLFAGLCCSVPHHMMNQRLVSLISTGMQVAGLQTTCQASQAALQLLRTDHSQQTSRLAAANAELLQLRSQVASLQAALQQQQQDVASALSIMSCRDAAAPAAAAAVAGAAPAAIGGLLRSQHGRVGLRGHLYSGSGSDEDWQEPRQQQQQQQVRCAHVHR
jgi:hypothetical protein